MRYRLSGRAFFGLWFIALPAALALLLSAIFGGAAAVDAVPDQRAAAALSFLASHGQTADAASCETAEVTIPERFGTVYEDYNAIQLAQGFDLTSYRGQTLTRYTFSLADPPAGAGGRTLANVFFDGNVIVAADLCDVGLNGAIRGVIG